MKIDLCSAVSFTAMFLGIYYMKNKIHRDWIITEFFTLQATKDGDKPGLEAMLQKVLQLYASRVLSKRSYAKKGLFIA